MRFVLKLSFDWYYLLNEGVISPSQLNQEFIKAEERETAVKKQQAIIDGRNRSRSRSSIENSTSNVILPPTVFSPLYMINDTHVHLEEIGLTCQTKSHNNNKEATSSY